MAILLFQDSAGTIPVVINNEPVGLVIDKSGNAINAAQTVSAARPTYNDTPDRLTLDKVDDAIVIQIPAGGWIGSMVLATDEGTASYGINIPAGAYTLGGQFFPGNSINNLLIREGTVSASALAAVEQVFVTGGAKASYAGVTNFGNYWRDMAEIVSFPLIDTSSGTNFVQAWQSNGLTGFPLIDTSNGTNFRQAWFDNDLVSFPAIDVSSSLNFASTWQLNTDLESFPANFFDGCLATNFINCFGSTNLSQASIDAILVSINTNGTSNGTFDQSGGTAPSATGEAAVTSLRGRGWTVIVTGGF
jgi:hypothetical protein